MYRFRTITLTTAVLILLVLSFLTPGRVLASQVLGITPTATDTTAPPTPTNTTAPPTATDTPEPPGPPTPTGTVAAVTPSGTPIDPTVTVFPPVNSPTPTATISIVNPPPGSGKNTPTPLPILPSTGEFPPGLDIGMEWMFALVLLVLLAWVSVRVVKRAKTNQ